MNLTSKQIQKIEEIAKEYHLKLVLLFGSRVNPVRNKISNGVNGSLNRESDVDIAYLAEKSLNFNEECDLNYEFSNIFQTDRVDTVDLRKAPPLLLYAVFQKCQPLFQKDKFLFSTYRAYAFKKYIETKPLYEKKFSRLKKKIDKIKI